MNPNTRQEGISGLVCSHSPSFPPVLVPLLLREDRRHPVPTHTDNTQLIFSPALLHLKVGKTRNTRLIFQTWQWIQFPRRQRLRPHSWRGQTELGWVGVFSRASMWQTISKDKEVAVRSLTFNPGSPTAPGSPSAPGPPCGGDKEGTISRIQD